MHVYISSKQFVALYETFGDYMISTADAMCLAAECPFCSKVVLLPLEALKSANCI